MRTLFPHEVILKARITEEVRHLVDMFEEQDCSQQCVRLDKGERYVVVVLEFTMEWGGFTAASSLPAQVLPSEPKEKTTLIETLVTDVLLRRTYLELREHIRRAGWSENEVSFCEFSPQDTGPLEIKWA